MQHSGRAAWKSVLVTSVPVAGGLLIGKLIAKTLPAVQVRMAAMNSGRAISQYNQTHSIRKLQIGAGHDDYPGWLNTDVEPGPGEVYLDATKRFPVADGSFHYIFGNRSLSTCLMTTLCR